MQYLEYEHPVKAILSDSYTSIIAKISKVATEAYEREHGRRITKLTAGGVMTIRRCEIVATTYGLEDEQLSLLITELSYRGSNGSPIFGRPIPITQRPGIAYCIRDLIVLKKAESSQYNEQSPRTRAERKRISSQVDDMATTFQTQAYSKSSQMSCPHETADSDREAASQAEKIQGVNIDGPKIPAAANLTRKSRIRNVSNGIEVFRWHKGYMFNAIITSSRLSVRAGSGMIN